MKYSLDEAVSKAISQHREVKTIIRKILNWDTDLTIPENAKAYKRSKVAVYKFAQKYKLVFRQRRGRKPYQLVEKKREIAQALRKEGYTLKEIGKILNVKHQRISQLLSMMNNCDINEVPTSVRVLKTHYLKKKDTQPLSKAPDGSVYFILQNCMIERRYYENP